MARNAAQFQKRSSASRNSNGNAGTEEQGKPVRLKLRRVAGFRGASSTGPSPNAASLLNGP